MLKFLLHYSRDKALGNFQRFNHTWKIPTHLFFISFILIRSHRRKKRRQEEDDEKNKAYPCRGERVENVFGTNAFVRSERVRSFRTRSLPVRLGMGRKKKKRVEKKIVRQSVCSENSLSFCLVSGEVKLQWHLKPSFLTVSVLLLRLC